MAQRTVSQRSNQKSTKTPTTAQDKIALAFLNLEETADIVGGMKNNIIKDADDLKAAIREAGMTTTLAARDGEPRRVAMDTDTLESLVLVLEDLRTGLLDIQWLGETGVTADPEKEAAPIRFGLVVRAAKHLVEEVGGLLQESWAKDAKASLEGGAQ